MHFHDTADRKYAKNLRDNAPEAIKGFTDFNAGVFEKSNSIDRKTKELIAIAVAATTQCPHCMQSHVAAAKKAGATEAEVAESVMVASALRAGAAYTHGFLAMKLYNEESG